MVSFDDEATALAKASWILELGLGGAMYWELSGTFLPQLALSSGVHLQIYCSGDKGTGPREGMEAGHGKGEVPGKSLVQLVAETFAQDGRGLDMNLNRLEYPTSQFENLKNGLE